MNELKRNKSSRVRRLLLLPVWLCLVGLCCCYLYSMRKFIVDDTRYASEINAAAARHGLDSRLVRALVYEESRFRVDEVGGAGEIGLMQVIPARAGADWARANHRSIPERSEFFDPEFNLEVGCWFLRDGMDRFKDYDHAAELALARYNAGLTRAKKWAPQDKKAPVIDNIDIASTRRYVSNIMKRYQRYCKEK